MLGVLYALSGFVIGLLIGLTGVGGGSLMTPLLVLLFGFHPATAVGTDLFFAAATKSVGTLMHGWRKTVDWRVVIRLACGSVPATFATLLTLAHVGPQSQGTARLISLVLGIALLLTAVTLVFRHQIVSLAAERFGAPNPRLTLMLSVITGVALGVLVSISSVGAGALGVTALILLYPRLPMARIVGSDVAHAVPLTLLAGAGHWLLGAVDWSLLGSLLIGSVPGIVAGSYAASRVPEAVLRPLLAAILVITGGRLVV